VRDYDLLINIFSFVKNIMLDIEGCDCVAAIKAATSGADNVILPHQPFATQGNLSAPFSAQSWQNKFAKRIYICDPELGTFWNFIRTPILCVRIIVKTVTRPADIIRAYPPFSTAKGFVTTYASARFFINFYSSNVN